jgi:hypothetical protein
MKKLNEVARMQKLAGILKENRFFTFGEYENELPPEDYSYVFSKVKELNPDKSDNEIKIKVDGIIDMHRLEARREEKNGREASPTNLDDLVDEISYEFE